MLNVNGVIPAKNYITKLKNGYNEKHGNKVGIEVLQFIKAGRHALTEKREGRHE